MAPSATIEFAIPVEKAEVSKEPERHVHGGEDKTPLEAISHGETALPGKRIRNTSISQWQNGVFERSRIGTYLFFRI